MGGHLQSQEPLPRIMQHRIIHLGKKLFITNLSVYLVCNKARMILQGIGLITASETQGSIK